MRKIRWNPKLCGLIHRFFLYFFKVNLEKVGNTDDARLILSTKEMYANYQCNAGCLSRHFISHASERCELFICIRLTLLGIYNSRFR